MEMRSGRGDGVSPIPLNFKGIPINSKKENVMNHGTGRSLVGAFSLLIVHCMATIAQAAPVYIKNFGSFPAYPYNTSSYKQGGAFIGCGPTAGAMILGYFQHAEGLSGSTGLLTNPGSGVDEGLNTAWALHGSSYMQTPADGFGSQYEIEPGLEKYAKDHDYEIDVMLHVSDAFEPNSDQFVKYGPYGTTWLNDGFFYMVSNDRLVGIDAVKFCDFAETELAAGNAIFLSIDTDLDGNADHWVPLVGFDRATLKYAYYDTYGTTVQWADIYYSWATPKKTNAITAVRTVAYIGPIQLATQPDINANPASFNFGAVTAGQWKDKTIVISNSGTADLRITATAIMGRGPLQFKIQSGGHRLAFTLAPGETHNVVVRFTPTGLPNPFTSATATLSISSNDPDENPFMVDLSGSARLEGSLIDVDGIKDDFYSQLTGPDNGYLQIKSYAYNENGVPAGDADLSAKIWTAWDNTWFYFYEEVKDDSVRGNSPNPWEEDELELYFDPRPTDSLSADVFNVRLTALGKAAPGVVCADSMNSIPDEQKRWTRNTTPDGYVLELAVQWSALAVGGETISPAVGSVFGMAVNQHDNDNGFRQATVQWAAVLSDMVYYTPKYHGTVKFLADHKLQFIPANAMTGVANPVPYDGTPTYDRTGDKKATITFTVSVPAGTPASDQVYIAGNFNFWDPGPGQAGTDGLEHDVLMTKSGADQWQTSLNFDSGLTIEYKYTRGSWAQVEKGGAGEEIADRTLTIPEANGAQDDVVGSWTDIGSAVDDRGADEVKAFQLFQNYPNPFNPSTLIRYALPREEQVILEVYDTKGGLVRTLVNQRQQAGYHSMTFRSAGLASGVYFCRLQAGAFTANSKMLLIR
jgi:hypothetical protein